MDRQYFLNRFQFNDHLVFDEKIKAITTINMHAAINDRQLNLSFTIQSKIDQLMN